VRLGSVCTVSISDLIWADGSGSDGSQRRVGQLTAGARVPSRNPARARRESTAAVFW
jgi:hypothetical protein